MNLVMKTLVSFLSLSALAACEGSSDSSTTEDGFVVSNLPRCGIERVGEFSLYRERPVINEGNGYVGFLTEEQNATGVNKQRYSLVNCATRALIRIESDIAAVAPTDDEPTLFQRIDRLRDRSRLANEELLTSAARENGYDVTVATLPPAGDPRAARADCGCGRFYRDTVQTN